MGKNRREKTKNKDFLGSLLFKYKYKYAFLITWRPAELHVWLGPYKEYGTSQQGPRMLLASHSQDGAAQPLQGEGPLSERHREGHAGTGGQEPHIGSVSGHLRARKSYLRALNEWSRPFTTKFQVKSPRLQCCKTWALCLHIMACKRSIAKVF